MQSSNCWEWGRRKKEEGRRRKKGEGRRKKEEGGRKKGKTAIPVSLTSVS
ncbi:hypothetical protein [Microcoleus sp. B7-D4]